MIKVAVIGAGSIGFTRGIVRDLLCVPEFRDSIEFAFTDISARNLAMVYRLCRRDMEANGVRSTLKATTNRREALKGAKYVFCVVRVGGLEAFQHDVDIPLRYGVDQCVGDTLCVGGIMYAQRTIPVLLEFCRDIREVGAPDAMLISHVNPMAMNTWACNKYGGIPMVGLCHGVQHGHAMIAEVLGRLHGDKEIRPQDPNYLFTSAVGINHQTWFVEILYKGRRIRSGELLEAFEKHPHIRQTEKVRIDMLRRFGYFSTESNGHLSEYVPWYRKRPNDIPRWIDLSCWINGETGGYLRVCREGRNWFQTDFPNWLKGEPERYAPERRGAEHGSYIIEALETGRAYRGHFNVVNRGCVANLPTDAIVEVPGYVDRFGLRIPIHGELPLGCAAVCNASISVQRLAVEAAVHGDDALLRQAAMMDPLTGAVCDPPEIWQMIDEMLVAEARWLPQYAAAIRAARRRLAKGPRIPVREGYKGAARVREKTVVEMARHAEEARKMIEAENRATAGASASVSRGRKGKR